MIKRMFNLGLALTMGLATQAQKTVVLTFDDAIASHFSVAAPVLKQYGFGATFYVCEFPPDFSDTTKYMNWRQIKLLSLQGFEIGNHTGHHTGVGGVDSVALDKEVDYIEQRCEEWHIPKPRTFAYPGCGSSPEAVKVLKARGYLSARTCDPKPFDVHKDDPFYMPSYAIQGTDTTAFYKALSEQQDGQVIVFLFHGVPDNAHGWVNTPEDVFTGYMEYLHTHHYRVVAIKDVMK